MWSGDDGTRACYSSSTATQTVSIVSAETLVLYIDAQILNTSNQGLSIGFTPAISTGSRYYGDLSRRAIKLGTTAANTNSTTVSISAISFWASSGTIITKGRIYLYGIYIAKSSDETSLTNLLMSKGLTIY